MFVNNKEQIEWHNVEAFGKNADFIESYVFKGDFILIQGFLSTASFKDKSGAERKTYSVKVSTINKPKSGDAKPSGNTQQYHGNEDDIPY